MDVRPLAHVHLLVADASRSPTHPPCHTSQEALALLQSLQEQDPSIQLLQGRILKRLGDTRGALQHLSRGMDLAGPPTTSASATATALKEAIERLHQPEEEEEEEDVGQGDVSFL